MCADISDKGNMLDPAFKVSIADAVQLSNGFLILRLHILVEFGERTEAE